MEIEGFPVDLYNNSRVLLALSSSNAQIIHKNHLSLRKSWLKLISIPIIISHLICLNKSMNYLSVKQRLLQICKICETLLEKSSKIAKLPVKMLPSKTEAKHISKQQRNPDAASGWFENLMLSCFLLGFSLNKQKIVGYLEN